MQQQGKNVCFTINNYTDDDVRNLKLCSLYTYIILGYEVGESKTPHIQGFMQLKAKIRLTGLKKIHKMAHWEFMRGTVEQAITYCKKDGVFDEKGEIEYQGRRTDLETANERWNTTGKIRSIFGPDGQECPNIQVQRSILGKATYLEKIRDWVPNVIWIYGESGSGKSKLAREMCAEVNEKCAEVNYYEKDETIWWDGYDAHEIVIMDDFRPSNMKMNTLLRILDRYGYRVQVKGGYRQLLAKTIILTSIQSPRDMYNFENEPNEQLIRRITKIIKTLKSVPKSG